MPPSQAGSSGESSSTFSSEVFHPGGESSNTSRKRSRISSGAGAVQALSTLNIEDQQRPEGSSSSNSKTTAPARPKKAGSHGTKQQAAGRQQFSACGACRLRRVKCNLRERQEIITMAIEKNKALGITDDGITDIKLVVCSNCEERNMRCIDEFAQHKKAKLLRRGKVLGQLESIYGNTAPPAEGDYKGKGPAAYDGLVQMDMGGWDSDWRWPEITLAFLQSSFYRRLHVQRPIIDPRDIASRFCSSNPPSSANLGPVGAVITHCYYAWAVSYGIDEKGNEMPGSITHSERERRRVKCNEVVNDILKEIDSLSIMRRPTWDGVRVLLFLLPLCKEVMTQLELLAMYETAVAQVFSLSGQPTPDGEDNFMVKAMCFWYSWVHESITTGIHGGKLVLDDDDMASFTMKIDSHTSLVRTSHAYAQLSEYISAPVRLAHACRLVHKALTGPKAMKKESVNEDWLREAWEALDKCQEEFESIRALGPVDIMKAEDVERYCDGWKIFIFECHSVIREALARRASKLQATAANEGFVFDPSNPQTDTANINYRILKRLSSVALSKCAEMSHEIAAIVKQQLGTSFFEYDASLVRDGTFYAASLLAVDGGHVDEIHTCLHALSEMRWAYSKTTERSETIKKLWHSRQEREQKASPTTNYQSDEAILAMLHPYVFSPEIMHMEDSSSYFPAVQTHDTSFETQYESSQSALSGSHDSPDEPQYVENNWIVHGPEAFQDGTLPQRGSGLPSSGAHRHNPSLTHSIADTELLNPSPSLTPHGGLMNMGPEIQVYNSYDQTMDNQNNIQQFPQHPSQHQYQYDANIDNDDNKGYNKAFPSGHQPQTQKSYTSEDMMHQQQQQPYSYQPPQQSISYTPSAIDSHHRNPLYSAHPAPLPTHQSNLHEYMVHPSIAAEPHPRGLYSTAPLPPRPTMMPRAHSAPSNPALDNHHHLLHYRQPQQHNLQQPQHLQQQGNGMMYMANSNNQQSMFPPQQMLLHQLHQQQPLVELTTPPDEPVFVEMLDSNNLNQYSKDVAAGAGGGGFDGFTSHFPR